MPEVFAGKNNWFFTGKKPRHILPVFNQFFYKNFPGF